MIDIPQHHLLSIRQILLRHIPDIEVKAFGSRVSGTAKPYSDLDLVIMGGQKIDPRVLAQLKEDFEESDIPFRVEILDWHGITDDFKKIIEQCCEVI